MAKSGQKRPKHSGFGSRMPTDPAVSHVSKDILFSHFSANSHAAAGLVFAALGFAWDKTDARSLVYVFASVGISIAVITLLTTIAATKAMYRLYTWWLLHQPTDYAGPGVMGYAPTRAALQSPLRYATAWNVYPVVFSLAWLVILWIKLHRA